VIRAVLVDDEGPARVRLRALLAEFDDVEVVGEAEDGAEAIAGIAGWRPDLIFLDIQMPGLTGLQVAASLVPPRPRIVFCTAFDQYAVDAFEQNAVDYLLKPLSRSRLARALERIRQAAGGGRGFQHEVQAARETQARLMPQSLPALDGMEFAGHCSAAREVGGDFYDFLPLAGGRLGIVVSDVSGKGLFAGILMASLQARLQSLAPRVETRLEPMFGELNRMMLQTTDSNRYATMFYGDYDDSTREMRYINAGHNPGLVMRAQGRSGDDRFTRLVDGGPAIGMLPDAGFRQGSVKMLPGDVLVLYSDGLTETTGRDGLEFGVERLESIVDRHADQRAEELVKTIVDAVNRYRGDTTLTDDLTLVVAKATG
jgi:serine phosphatase RsbU (regulator of sigma subunit)